MEPKTPKKNKATQWLVFLSFPIQMGAIIYGFFRLGDWLSDKYPSNRTWLPTAFIFLGFILSMYYLIRQLNDLNKKG